MKDATVETYPQCFGCGQENPIGLRLSPHVDGDAVVASFVPKDDHQGWPGIVHGGIIASLLYEVLENFAHQRGIVAMMRRMDTRLRRPAKTGVEIKARSWLTERSDREMHVSATLTSADGVLIAEGEAALVILSPAQRARLGIG